MDLHAYITYNLFLFICFLVCFFFLGFSSKFNLSDGHDVIVTLCSKTADTRYRVIAPSSLHFTHTIRYASDAIKTGVLLNPQTRRFPRIIFPNRKTACLVSKILSFFLYTRVYEIKKNNNKYDFLTIIFYFFGTPSGSNTRYLFFFCFPSRTPD